MATSRYRTTSTSTEPASAMEDFFSLSSLLGAPTKLVEDFVIIEDDSDSTSLFSSNTRTPHLLDLFNNIVSTLFTTLLQLSVLAGAKVFLVGLTTYLRKAKADRQGYSTYEDTQVDCYPRPV